MSEQQNRRKLRDRRDTNRLREKRIADMNASHATLLDYLEEAHEPEVEADHHGDKSGCTYCAAIKKAKTIRLV